MKPSPFRASERAGRVRAQIKKVDVRRSGKASDEAEIRLLASSSDQEGKVPPAAPRSLEPW